MLFVGWPGQERRNKASFLGMGQDTTVDPAEISYLQKKRKEQLRHAYKKHVAVYCALNVQLSPCSPQANEF